MRFGKAPGGIIGTLFLLFFFLGLLDSILPLLLIIGAVGFIAYKAVEASKTNEYTNGTRGNSGVYRTVNRKTNYHGMSDSGHTPDQKATVNTYLLKRYRMGRRTLAIRSGTHNILLTLKSNRFTSIDQLKIDCDGHSFDTVTEFRAQYSALYDQLFDTLLVMARNGVGLETVYQEPVKTQEPQPEPEKKKEPSNAAEFRELIDDLNGDIPDEEITKGLYETSLLLKQLSELEHNFPDQKAKLNKLYKSYLPYMIEILKQYVKMQNVQTDSKYEENVSALKKTIGYINSAMRDKLIPSMSETDSINLSADMSTLEAMLRKDGMAGDDMMMELKKQERKG